MVDEEFFAEYKKTAPTKIPGIPHFEMNRPLVTNKHKGTIGLEIELEGRNNFPVDGDLEKIFGPETKAKWTSVRDGSLRGHSTEYVFNRPCTITELPILVNGLWDRLREYGTIIENSNRCSTHVHLNMTGLKVNQITSIIALWNVFEEALIEWCGELRKANHFCLSSKEAASTLRAWDTFLETGHRPTVPDLKYSALNILTIDTIGSLEFRCGPAADSPDIPITWATFLHHFVKYATERFLNPRELAYALSERGGEEIFRDICNRAGLATFANEVMAKVPNFDRSCMVGFRNAQCIVMGYSWDDWMPLINKEYVPDPFAKAVKVKVPRGARAVPPGEGFTRGNIVFNAILDNEGRIRRDADQNRVILDDIIIRNPQGEAEQRAPMAMPLHPPYVTGDVTYITVARRRQFYQYVVDRGWVDIQDFDEARFGRINWHFVEQIENDLARQELEMQELGRQREEDAPI